jgi:hypothetical protein
MAVYAFIFVLEMSMVQSLSQKVKLPNPLVVGLLARTGALESGLIHEHEYAFLKVIILL